MGDEATTKNSSSAEDRSSGPDARRRLPPLRALFAFEAAARHVNFTLAAAELAVTPSAVSHQIQALETFLETRLFSRQAGHVELTAAGEMYRREIEAALQIIAAATQRIAPQSQAETLVVMASPSFASKWLQPRLSTFLDAYPDVRVRLATMDNPTTIRLARTDVAVCYGAPESPEMQVMARLSETVRPLCSPSLVSALDLREPRDLSRATLIHSSNTVTWDVMLRRARLGALRPSNEIWLDRSAMAIDAAVAGLGVVLESDLLVQAELADGRLVAPFGDALETKCHDAYAVMAPRGYRARRACVAFIDWLVRGVPVAHHTAVHL